MKQLLSVVCLLLCAAFLKAQNPVNITPTPVSVKVGKSTVAISQNTTIVLLGSGLEKCSIALNDYLWSNYGIKLKTAKKRTSNNVIVLNVERMDGIIPGSYHLTADKKGVYITGDNEQGVFYGIQTLTQLLPTYKATVSNQVFPLRIPEVDIYDFPRFAYRGMHLDVGRHFFPVSFIKKYIDYLAAYKYNTFHWHLTEDQGWRIEIKKYPLLTKVGGCRAQTLVGRYGSNKYDGKKYCGFYTQEQIKEVVKYAADHYITIIPEIEMPGHSMAALASYPYLGCTKGPYKTFETWGVIDDVYCAGNDSTFTFLENVLDEVMQLFPSKYIHIGGDECPKERWKQCPLCQKRMQDEHLKDEHALQSYFINRIEKYLNSKGRNIIGWDEILEGGLAPNATVMSWRGEEGGIEAAKQNHDVIMTPGSHCYLDHSQSKNEDSLTIGGYLPLDKVYSYEPVPAALDAAQAKHILGAQGNVWTEYMDNTKKVEYMIFPRMMALSEVLWSPKEKRNWNDFERRIPGIFDRLDQQYVNYSKAYFDLKATVVPSPDNTSVLWKLESKNPEGIIKVAPTAYSSELQDYVNPILINNDITKTGYLMVKEKLMSPVSQSFHFNKATGKKITLVNEPAKNYPGDGAFTLVNGVQNEKGLARSNEFLGFNGKDLDATIDLGQLTDVKSVTLHFFEQQGSWIYAPSQFAVQYLYSLDTDEKAIMRPVKMDTIDIPSGKGLNKMTISTNQNCRYIHIIAKNFGTIPSGNPGAGNPAWLFVDEIEVE
ncbi:MAG: beta-N-acetylhexosaminidase [Bacteroidetes bacterium]|nr:beta-N-acetylhexosaminidase [Bacteroidota bacterium]